MKFILKRACLLFLCLGLLTVCFSRTHQAIAAVSGSVARDFTLSDLEGNSFTLSSFSGKQPVIVFFWTTWCPFCRKELKVLKEHIPQLKEQQIAVLAVNVQESSEKVRRLLGSDILPFPVLLDKNAEVASDYGIMGIPTYVVINKLGQIVFIDNYFPEKNLKELLAK